MRNKLLVSFLILSACADVDAGRAVAGGDAGGDAGQLVTKPDTGSSDNDAGQPDSATTTADSAVDSTRDTGLDTRSDTGTLTAPDSSVVPDASNPTEQDAGQPVPDSGTPGPADAGTVHTVDSGTPSQADAGSMPVDSGTPVVDAGPPVCQSNCLTAFSVTVDPGEPAFDVNDGDRARGLSQATDLGIVRAVRGSVRISAVAATYQDSDWFKFKLESAFSYFDFFWGPATGAPITRQIYITCAPETLSCLPALTISQFNGVSACGMYTSRPETVYDPNQPGEYAACKDPTIYIRAVGYASQDNVPYTFDLDIHPLDQPRIQSKWPQREGPTY